MNFAAYRSWSERTKRIAREENITKQNAETII